LVVSSSEGPVVQFLPMLEMSLFEYIMLHTVDLLSLTVVHKLCKELKIPIRAAATPAEIVDALLGTRPFADENDAIRTRFLEAVQKRARQRTKNVNEECEDDAGDADPCEPVRDEPLPEPPAILASMAGAELSYLKGEGVVWCTTLAHGQSIAFKLKFEW
jgi:hypothetical protein